MRLERSNTIAEHALPDGFWLRAYREVRESDRKTFWRMATIHPDGVKVKRQAYYDTRRHMLKHFDVSEREAKNEADVSLWFCRSICFNRAESSDA